VHRRSIAARVGTTSGTFARADAPLGWRLFCSHRGMFHKVAAVWLLALALSPFTTPFSTCELRLFFSSGPRDTGAPLSDHVSLAIAPSQALPEAASAVPPLTGRMRIVSLASTDAGICPLAPRVGLAVSMEIPHLLRHHDQSLLSILRV
jgi:hypothetical protein